MGCFFGRRGTPPPPPPRPWDVYIVSKAFLPGEWKRYIEFQGAPSSHADTVFLVLGPLGTPGNLTRPGSGLLS